MPTCLLEASRTEYVYALRTRVSDERMGPIIAQWKRSRAPMLFRYSTRVQYEKWYVCMYGMFSLSTEDSK